MNTNETQAQNGSNSAQDIITNLADQVFTLATKHTEESLILESKLRYSSNWMQIGLEVDALDEKSNSKLQLEIKKALDLLTPLLK